jgi:TRAP-type mannitol/chloroaromatic compound transport system substrate-binding protein
MTHICLLLEKLKVHEQEWVLPIKYRRLGKPKISSYLLFCAFLDEGSLNDGRRLE